MSDLCICFVLFFFFFKQKTAYEMRISDWSSDVCSSDLADAPSAARPGAAGRVSGEACHALMRCRQQPRDRQIAVPAYRLIEDGALVVPANDEHQLDRKSVV